MTHYFQDGFPIYGPVQYFSDSEKKIYLDPANCADCTLKQLQMSDLDNCGGQLIADGDAAVGKNTKLTESRKLILIRTENATLMI